MKSATAPLAAVISGAVAAGYAALSFTGSERDYRLWYYTPAAALAGAFMASRLASHVTRRAIAVDVVVALLCLARPLTGQPPVSGHAWFAVHALLTLKKPFSLTLAAIVLGITLYAKLVLWHGDVTLWPGLAAGLLSGWLWRRWQLPARP